MLVLNGATEEDVVNLSTGTRFSSLQQREREGFVIPSHADTTCVQECLPKHSLPEGAGIRTVRPLTFQGMLQHVEICI